MSAAAGREAIVKACWRRERIGPENGHRPARRKILNRAPYASRKKSFPTNPYFDYYGYMDSVKAIEALGSLAQNTRLDVFKLLVRHEPAGMPAGEIAKRLDVPPNTMSSHLSILSRADLVTSKRQSRLIIYRANLATMNALMAFMLENCCSGEDCAPIANQLERLCQ